VTRPANADDVVVVLSTAPAAAPADSPGGKPGGKLGATELAQRLVQERLCACANVVPGIQSFFWWQGSIDTATESLLVLKTTRARAAALRARLLALHPYEVPEVLELLPAGGHGPYLDWVRASVPGSPE
jgi:periplasmic divalent cation tolerance protein